MATLTFNYLSQASDRLTLFTKGLMKIRILTVAVPLLALLWSCDAPPANENDTLIYNPFSFTQDTLDNTGTLSSGTTSIAWGEHLSAWVGATSNYKSGVSCDFTFADSGLDVVGADSIQLQVRHQLTFLEDPDQDPSGSLPFGFYETTDQSIDIVNSNYGTVLGSDSFKVDGGDDFWRYTLPENVILSGDTSISIGVFPEVSGALSFIQGGSSGTRPRLTFFYHAADTAGQDSVTSVSFLADTLNMYLAKLDAGFSSGFQYLSQMARDSILFHFDLQSLQAGTDTLVQIDSASFEPAVSLANSAIYRPDTSTTQRKFFLTAEDPISAQSASLVLLNDGSFLTNDIHLILQQALDEDRTQIDLILRPNHTGFDPGFIAIDTTSIAGQLVTRRTLAVRP